MMHFTYLYDTQPAAQGLYHQRGGQSAVEVGDEDGYAVGTVDRVIFGRIPVVFGTARLYLWRLCNCADAQEKTNSFRYGITTYADAFIPAASR